PWTDLYALGVMAWKLAHGAPPRPAPDGQPTWTEPRFPVPEGWVRWVSSLLRARTSERVRGAARAWETLRALGPTPRHLAPPSAVPAARAHAQSCAGPCPADVG
ncbi:MAG: hypothetical protein KC621_25165, partial [Myxococcales bacterium]|nr:hypothetical protein [Myxococcales bacterium]